jgi:PhnB protein
MNKKYKPNGFHTLTPNLICKGAAEAIEFYKAAFGAEELYRLEYPGGGVGHAELMIGDSPIMLADEHPDMNLLSPTTIGNWPVSFHLYVPDAESSFARAIAAGATEVKPVEMQFYGDLAGRVLDPYGYSWHIATATKQFSKEEMLAVWDEMMKNSG